MSSLLVPHALQSAAVVRHRVTEDLVARHLPGPVVDDAALVMTELVGNAVRHGAALPGGGVLAQWQVHGSSLRLEVVDGGPGPQGPTTQADVDAEGGRGLALVRALARRWGSAPARPGTAVWAELPTTGLAATGSAPRAAG